MERLIQILTMHQARVIDPQRDICVVADEDEPQKFNSIVIFLDDFSHLRANDKDDPDGGEDGDDDELSPKIVHLYSETDDEDGGPKDGKGESG